jgi:hypothetical protein
MPSVNIRISVADIDVAIAAYDSIRVRRSRTLIGGPYELTTANAPTSAQINAPIVGPYNVSGKTFSLLVDGDPQLDVLFTGVDPLTTADVAAQINTAAGDTIAFDGAGGELELISTITGTASKLEVATGTAESDFGWVSGDRDSGEDAHVSLIAGQSLYDYTDNDGDIAYFYKTQYFNTVNNLTSTESEPFLGGPGPILPSIELSIATIDLVDQSGSALPGQESTFYSVQDFVSVTGFTVALQRAPVTIVTDNFGHAELNLVRGLVVKVVFQGTTVIREFTVPDVTTFDLLSVLGSSPDPFDIVILPFKAAPRRTP